MARRPLARAMRDVLAPAAAMPRSVWLPALGAGYVVTVALLGGLRADHFVIGALGLLDVYNRSTQRFLRTFLPVIATGILFDAMRYFYWDGIAGRIHVAEPYHLDRALFGVGGRTLNEVFVAHHWAAADVVTGLAYLTFVAEYLALAMIAHAYDDVAAATAFARCFLVVNVLGFITYFIYPAAPPWYVAAHGFVQPPPGVIASAAGAARFDALLGTHVFADVYGRGVDVFGAIPSLHVAYPLIAAVLAFRTPVLRPLRWPAAAFVPVMCFSAIYLQHHYVIDVVLGLGYAIATVAIVGAYARATARRPA